MSKKTFKDAPAMAFISTPQEGKEVTVERVQQEERAPHVTAAGQEPDTQIKYKVDPRLVSDPTTVESKTRRVQLLLKPSTYKKAHDMAAGRRISLNELITQLIEGGTQ